MMKTMTVLVVIERLMTFAFAVLLLTKGAAAIDLVKVDVSWYAVFAPLGVNLLLLPISMLIVKRQLDTINQKGTLW